MNSQSSSSPKILVVGAGPTGLVMSLALLRHGVPVRLIDQEVQPRLGQRGAGLMPRSQELFHALGVGGEILRCAIPVPPAVMYEMPGGTKILNKFDMWPPLDPTTRVPFVSQRRNAWSRSLGTDITLGIEEVVLRGRVGDKIALLQARQNSVCAQISLPGDAMTEMATFDYVIGADGARGVVRKELGLTFIGETSNADNLMIGDIMVEGLDPNVWHMWGEVGSAWASLRPTEVPNMYNFLLSGRDINHAELVAHPEALIPLFVEYTGGRKDIAFKDIVWLSHYRPNIRMVDQFGVGRVFIAGDAAHVHSIIGGQGANTGIQDSLNLAWKLALVQRNLAPKSLLHTYNEERVPVVAEMLENITSLLKETLLRKSGGQTYKGKAWAHNGGALQLGVNCRWSSIVVDEQQRDDFLANIDGDFLDDEEDACVDELSAGDRAPDAPGLVDMKRRSTDNGTTTSLSQIFVASSHTVLIFTNEANRYTPVIRLLSAYPKDTVQSAIIIRSQGTVPRGASSIADFVLEDREQHAYGTYLLDEDCDVVVIRPDGLIGAVVRSREGLERYFQGVFK